MTLRDQVYTIAFAAVVIVGFFFRKNVSDKNTKIVDIGFCIAAGLMASTFMTLFPLNNGYTSNDSSVFLYIGEKMLQGKLPYKDLFDHKGILLYFIQCLGLLMTPGSYTGIWIIEAVHLIAASFFMFKISGFFTKDRMIRCVSLFAVMAVTGMNLYNGGNFTEEYALPWIAYAVYLFLKYFQTFEYRFAEIVFLGIGFAVVLLLRVNMVIAWAAVMPLIIVYMIYKKQWKELGNCALAFLIGISVVVLPTLVYTFVTGCFGDMVDCYLLFNFAYSEGGLSPKVIFDAIKISLSYVPYVIAAFFISIYPGIKNRQYLLNLWVLFISLYFAHMSGRHDQHYSIILMPMMMALFVGALENLYHIFSMNGRFQWKLSFPPKTIMLLGIIGVTALSFAVQYKWSNLIEDSLFTAGNLDDIQEYLEEYTTEEDDVLIVGNDVKHYLLSRRRTDNKYFYQTPPIKVSKELSDKFIEEVKRCQSKAMIVMGDREKHLKREDSLGDAYRALNDMAVNGFYTCQVYDDYYIYERVEGK